MRYLWLMVFSLKLWAFDEAFVTFSDKNYFPLVEVLLDSVKAFSTRPIIVFGINADPPFSEAKYPFMSKRRIDIPRTSGFQFEKARILIEANVKRGVYVDADIVLNEGCDALFGHFDKIVDLPLCPILPWGFDPYEELLRFLGVEKKTMPYVHNPIVIFTEECLPFLQEWDECNHKYTAHTNTYDEGIMNVLLWKHHATEYINLCDPYYMLAFDYLNGSKHMHKIHAYENWYGKIDFLAFHGCKRAHEARNILNRLIEKKGHD